MFRFSASLWEILLSNLDYIIVRSFLQENKVLQPEFVKLGWVHDGGWVLGPLLSDARRRYIEGRTYGKRLPSTCSTTSAFSPPLHDSIAFVALGTNSSFGGAWLCATDVNSCTVPVGEFGDSTKKLCCWCIGNARPRHFPMFLKMETKDNRSMIHHTQPRVPASRKVVHDQYICHH
jgi:hypothetical protein